MSNYEEFISSLHDFGGACAQTYVEACPMCGKEHFVSGQIDDTPEYYTLIFVRCDCGASVRFNLPVN